MHKSIKENIQGTKTTKLKKLELLNIKACKKIILKH